VRRVRQTASGDAGYWDAAISSFSKEETNAVWRAHSDAVNAALLSPWLPRGQVDRLLKTDAFEEAVAAGLYPVLAPHARRVTLIDVSGAALDAARTRYPAVETVLADARELPFEDGSFEVVVSTSTLDHFRSLEDIAAGLWELHRVLRPGGELLLTLDNRANPVVALRNALPYSLLERLHLVPMYVGATCGPCRLRRLLVDAGFETREVCAALHCPRALAVFAAGVVARASSPAAERTFLRLLMRFESLERLPTRYLTGYFVAARARRR